MLAVGVDTMLALGVELAVGGVYVGAGGIGVG